VDTFVSVRPGNERPADRYDPVPPGFHQQSARTTVTENATSTPVGWLRGVVFTCHDYRALAGFYQRLLKLDVYKEIPDWLELAAGSRSGVVLGFEPASAEREAGRQGSIRVDVEVEDLDEAQAVLEAEGARLVAVVHANPEEEHRIMADPEGNEFNIVLPFPPGW
jgi:predicted enzyme related to lactoylglutathione lyase